MEFEKQLTIIITASFIRSHPSIKIIKETIESLKLINLSNDTRIILAHDYSDNPLFLEYINNLKDYIKFNKNIEIIIRKNKGHLTGNIRNVIDLIHTKYILIIQHDLPFIRNFFIEKVIEDMEIDEGLKHVRFNKRRNKKYKYDAINDLFGLQKKVKNFVYTRTPAWSDNNHICLTSYYKDLILKECLDGKPMEYFLQGKTIDEIVHKKYGTYLFGNINHRSFIKSIKGRQTK